MRALAIATLLLLSSPTFAQNMSQMGNAQRTPEAQAAAQRAAEQEHLRRLDAEVRRLQQQAK